MNEKPGCWYCGADGDLLQQVAIVDGIEDPICCEVDEP